ncbi:c-type cytochrome [Desulfohalovibrio reitneri]|uniref:c-type cytochrome n=1 Tax=Desulfohalovibrio reitneri TaxID=1307759 RepID=UPI0004A71039|nr:cytochrome c [Desulfohalovibrio reitneri]
MSVLMKVLCLLAFVLVFAAMTTHTGRASDDGERILNNVCNQCHSHERVCRNLGRDEGFWDATVNRMRGNGAPLSDEDIETMVTFLSGLEKNAPVVCE